MKLNHLLVAAIVATGLAVTVHVPELGAQKPGLRIAVVDMNRCINQSQAGKRSKKILIADKTQMETGLKIRESDLKKQSEELKANILLTDEARQERQTELIGIQRELRDAVKRAQKELQDKERRYTETIFTEIKTVVSLIARDKNLDLVLEKQAAQLLLFTTFEMEDITTEVISRYDNIQDSQ